MSMFSRRLFRRFIYERLADKRTHTRKDGHTLCEDSSKKKHLVLRCQAVTPKQQTARLDGFVPPERPKIPSVVIHCVLEVEKRGLSQPGAYESGVRRVVDLPQELLEVLS